MGALLRKDKRKNIPTAELRAFGAEQELKAVLECIGKAYQPPSRVLVV